MLNSILYEIIKLKWLAIANIIVVLIMCALFWFFSRDFKFNKKVISVFSILYKLDKKQILCVALIFGRLLFAISSIIFCSDINIGHLIVFVLFTLLILIIGRDIKVFISSLINYVAVFLLVFIESTLFNYYFEVERMAYIIVMAVLIGLFVLSDAVLTSLKNYQEIIKKEVTNA